MARKTKANSEEKKPTRLMMPIAEAANRINERIQKGLELKAKPITSADALEKARKEYYSWTEFNDQLLKRIFSTDEMAHEYSYSGLGGFVRSDYTPLSAEIKEHTDDIDNKIRVLESIRDRLELVPLDEGITHSSSFAPSRPQEKDLANVFVVHGHDEGARELIARFVEKIKLNPVILHEQANEGKTIIEKLEKHSDVGFAVVLLTPDDEGRKKSDGGVVKDRARQNVILELGYFIGKLGRSNVCALHKGSVEIPSDYIGVVFIPLDESEGWKFRLAKELRAAGFTIDMNDI